MMGNQLFIYVINIILVSRLGYVLRDSPLTKKDLRYLILFQFLGFVMLGLSWTSLILLILVAVVNPIVYYLENQNGDNLLKLIKLRIIFLLAYVIIFSFIFSKKIFPGINPYPFGAILVTLSEYFILADWWLARILGAHEQIILMGLLLTINEANLLIRLYFQTSGLLPRREGETTEIAPQPETQAEPTRAPIDIKEYNAGRVIGILERVLIYFFVLYGHFTAIGFVIAAKSFTRFRELNKRHFAEYVLIGTLLSCTLALAVAEFVKYLLV